MRQLNNGYGITKLQSSNFERAPWTFLQVHSVPTTSEDFFTVPHFSAYVFPTGFLALKSSHGCLSTYKNSQPFLSVRIRICSCREYTVQCVRRLIFWASLGGRGRGGGRRGAEGTYIWVNIRVQ
jgi:hypothetical protein